MKPFSLVLFTAAAGLMIIGSCDNPKTGSLFDPNYVAPRPSPTITTITPAGGALAVVDTLIISGTNFSPALSENTVYFDGRPTSLVSSTPTQLKLLSPAISGDTIKIKVGVVGADKFSNTVSYKLEPAIAQFGGLAGFELATAITTDNSGNLFTSYTANNVEAGILKLTPTGVRSQFAASTAGVTQWFATKVGPGGTIYAVRNVRAIYSYAPNGGSAALWVAFPSGVAIFDLDFDQDKNLWAVGNNTAIYRITPGKSVSSFAFTGNVRSVRVYNGYLYFASATADGEKVWRASISPTGLGTPEVYFDFGAEYPTFQALALTFSADGVMYVGTNAPLGMVVVFPNKSSAAPYSAYKALFDASCRLLAWGNAEYLYTVSGAGLLLRIKLPGKTSAPYYGTN